MLYILDVELNKVLKLHLLLHIATPCFTYGGDDDDFHAHTHTYIYIEIKNIINIDII